MTDASDDGKWYGGGLRFSCTQCGNCCTGAPGYVWVNKTETEKIAAYLGREGKGLSSAHLRRVGRRHSLTERSNGDCCFLRTEGGKRICGIYPVRPLQCRTWPFWSSNLKTPRDWEAASWTCPGMNNGNRYDLVQIEIRRGAKKWDDVLD